MIPYDELIKGVDNDSLEFDSKEFVFNCTDKHYSKHALLDVCLESCPYNNNGCQLPNPFKTKAYYKDAILNKNPELLI